MRQPIFAIFAIALILLSACGRELTGTKSNMTESQAITALQSVPMESSRDAFGHIRPSAQGLVALLQQLVAQGKIKLPNQHGAINLGSFDWSQLLSIFSALSGGANSIGSLGSALGGVATGGGLSGILSLLQAALPIITAIAPQYAGIVTALTTIIPLVVNIFSLFKKPAPAPTAWNFIMTPARA